MTAEGIARALGGYRSGSSYLAKCPAHNDNSPSLSITENDSGKVLVHCHAGCEQSSVVAALKALGLWVGSSERKQGQRGLATNINPPHAERMEKALRLWKQSKPGVNTAVQTYLRSRGITLPVPDRLRFYASLKHTTGLWPAMIGLVTRGTDDTPIAIHRTFLCSDGRGKAEFNPNKMMLGPCRGGAVRLAPAEHTVMIGEGIETCLSAVQATGLPAWAALSTSGLRSLELPTSIHRVIILADGDEAGDAAARAAAKRWAGERREVRTARCPRGADFNDLLLGRSTDNLEITA
jgi:putative DNA primase/helicase